MAQRMAESRTEGLRECMVKVERVVTGRSEGNCIYSSECGVDSLHVSLIPDRDQKIGPCASRALVKGGDCQCQ